MNKQTTSMTSLVSALLLCAAIAVGETPAFEGARDKVEQAQAEFSAGQKASKEGNEEQALSFMEMGMRYLDEARTEFEEGGVIEKGDADDLGGYAQTLTMLEQTDLAEEALVRAVASRPADASLWFTLGRTQSLRGTPGKNRAIETFARALDLTYDKALLANIHIALAGALQDVGLYDLAREHVDKGLEAAPDHVGGRLTLAALLIRHGEIAEASALLDAVSQESQQRLILAQDMMNEAMTDFEAARRWIDDEAEEHLAYAKLLVRTNRMQLSLFPLERAVALDPTLVVAWNLLGSVYRGMGANEQARTAYMKSLELDADQPRTREALEQLPAPEAAEEPESDTDIEATEEEE